MENVGYRPPRRGRLPCLVSVMRTLILVALMCVTVFRPYRVQYSRDPYSTVYAADPI